jgi:hypothetical protein
VPLTAGLGRGTLVPLFRPGEVLIILTLTALLLKRGLLRKHAVGWRIGWLDALILVFVAVSVLVPSIVLYAGGWQSDLTTWMTVLAPTQFLVVYWIYSRSHLDGGELKLVVHAILFTSLVVGVIGIAQAADLPGVRDLSDAYFPAPPDVAWEEPVYRANSTLEHFSALGSFAVFNFLLAFGLLTRRVPGFSTAWLATVMLINAGAIVASQTWAAAMALPFGCVVVCWHARRLPPHFGPLMLAGGLGLIAAWPAVSSRFAQQLRFVQGQPVLSMPHTMDVRIHYWSQFFLPTLASHTRYLLGTGTVIPSDVPASLQNFVDNEFIRMAFRAGIPGVAVLLFLQAGLLIAAFRARRSEGWWALAGTVAGCVVTLSLMEITAEYMGFAGSSQLFWMLTGLFVLALREQVTWPSAPTVLAASERRLVAYG